MTPTEFYALPTLSTDSWLVEGTDETLEILDLKHFDYDRSGLAQGVDGILTVDLKLRNSDGYRGVWLYAFSYRNTPFALLFTAGRGGRDQRTPMVTDCQIWLEARKHALSVLSANARPLAAVSPDKSVDDSFYGHRIARVQGEVRFVEAGDTDPITGEVVFDRERFERAFDDVFRKPGEGFDVASIVEEPFILAKAIEVSRAGVLGHRIDLDIDLGGGNRMFAASVIDDHLFAHVMDTKGKAHSWARSGVKTFMVGPSSLADVYCIVASGGSVAPDHPFVAEAASAFGADPACVYSELLDFVANGGDGLGERIVRTMPRDKRVPESITDDVETFTLAFMHLDNPDIRRFCNGGGFGQEEAADIVAFAAAIDEQRTAVNVHPRTSPT